MDRARSGGGAVATTSPRCTGAPLRRKRRLLIALSFAACLLAYPSQAGASCTFVVVADYSVIADGTEWRHIEYGWICSDDTGGGGGGGTGGGGGSPPPPPPAPTVTIV